MSRAHFPERGRLLWRLCRAAALAVAVLIAPARGRAGEVVVLSIDGAIGPATAEYVIGGLQQAAGSGAAAVVLRLDTPGGLDAAMRRIIRGMLASPVPVLGYVAPAGARAASAGTYILYASALAAMAPGTNLGAATPVSLFGESPAPPAKGPAPPASAERTKLLNDSAAYIRGLATLHDRNAAWAERAVREAVSLSWDEALREHVIDLEAGNLADLLSAADGRTVLVAGRTMRLATAGATIREVAPGWRDRLLSILTDPSILSILLLAGVVGIAFELSHPGIFAPGVLGTICLLLGAYGLNLLPIDYAGLALAAFGLALMVAEAFVPAFGAFVVGGAAAFLIGALMMFRAPGLQPPLGVLVALMLASVLLLGLVLGTLLRIRRRRVASGEAVLLGAEGSVTAWAGSEGQVQVGGETWRARAGQALAVGQRVRVVGRQGLWLQVQEKLR